MSIENIKILPNTNNKKVLFFWASWHESSKSGSQMDIVFQSLATTSTSVSFHKVEAEVVPELSTKYNVAVVPTFILLNNNNTLFRKVEGANPALLTQAVSALLQQQQQDNTASTNAGTPVNGGNNEDESDANANLNNRIKALLNSSKVLLFMKGNPTTPKCGFSRQIVELLQSNNINTFSTFDILTDPEIRQGLKTYSDWPTYPQLYVNGELVGGLDIVKEMIEDDGDLAESLGIEADVQLSLDSRLHSLTHKSKVMLFMKGNPSIMSFPPRTAAIKPDINAKMLLH